MFGNDRTVHGSILGQEKVRVMCVECKQTFPAPTTMIDPNTSLPQLNNNGCPVCGKKTKVLVTHGF